MSGNNGGDGGAASQAPLYTVKWPRAASHVTKSASGVLVEGNLRGQIALHVFNESRELEPRVEYHTDGSRAGAPRPVTYVREVTDTILIAESTARQLRDVLNELIERAAGEE